MSRASDDPQKNLSRWAETAKDFAPIKEQDESESTAEIWEWEQKLQYLIDKVAKKKYKEYEQKKKQHFDIFKMKLKDYNKEKELQKLRREELSKSYKYRKLRALYGNRLSSQILKGVLDEAGDEGSALGVGGAHGEPGELLRGCSAALHLPRVLGALAAHLGHQLVRLV